MDDVERIFGTEGDDVLVNTPAPNPGAPGGEGVFGLGGDDRMTLTAPPGGGTTQIHAYGGTGDDTLTLTYGAIDGFTVGHHVYGDDVLEGAKGADVFDFTGFDDVSGVVVGRIDDFDSARDEIRIDGVPVDLNDLPPNARLVAFAGDHNDPGAQEQRWLLIETGAGGHLFYALDGARVDMTGDGAADGGRTEAHFIADRDFDALFAGLEDVGFVPEENHVPPWAEAAGGVVINDKDRAPSDVLEAILGTRQGDLIAAGLNDDTVRAGGGDDRVWGGGGNDVVGGGWGDDVLRGGSGADRLFGGRGDDILDGNAGDDVLTGGRGADQFVFFAGSGTDRVRDFEQGVDVIDLRPMGLEGFADIADGIVDGPNGARIVLENGDALILTGIDAAALTADDFLFGSYG